MKWAPRFCLLLLGLTTMLWLVPAAAQAERPLLSAVDIEGHHVTATYTLGEGDDSALIELSADPPIGAQDFAFADPFLVEYAFGGSPYRTEHRVGAGQIWVHVAGYDSQTCQPETDRSCLEYSFAFLENVPEPAKPALLSVGSLDGHPTASWSLPSDMDSSFFVVTRAGALVFEEPLAGGATSYVATRQLAPGTYDVSIVGEYIDCVASTQCPPEESNLLKLTIPSGQGGGGPAGSSAAQDKKTAFASLKASSKQKIDKLTVSCSMAEAGTLSATGTVSVPGASKVYKFKKISASATAGKTVKLKLKLPKKALKALKKALKRKKLKAKLTITARDNAGNTKVQKKTVQLKP